MDVKVFLRHNLSIQLIQRQIVSETPAAGYTALSNINLVARKTSKYIFSGFGRCYFTGFY